MFSTAYKALFNSGMALSNSNLASSAITLISLNQIMITFAYYDTFSVSD